MKNLFAVLLIFLSFFVLGQSNYESNTLIVKVKESHREYFYQGATDNYLLEAVFSKFGVTSIMKEYPNSTKPRRQFHANGIPFTDISLIHRIKYTKDIDPKELVSKFMATNVFQYVEPSFIFQPLFKPNDPEIDSLYFMEMLNMYEAWDDTQGDTNIVIGISDTGFDTDHPDLVNSVKYNYDDPINGVDDDNDGYIDNFAGWDLADNDNDPQVGSNWHGIYVASHVGATVNNGIQLAGSAFNCKIVPLKIESGGALTHAYQSIIYAADHNFDVVNCSWGSPNSWSQQGQDIVSYSTVDKNCLVVASAGNDDSDAIWYPASFDWVLSVGGINENKEKWISTPGTGSTYNDYVDVVAPSVNLYRLNNGGGSILGGGLGTSFSAPIVSGVIGLIKSKNPTLKAYELMEQLKATCSTIDTISINAPYIGKLGKGIVNADSAVGETVNPGLLFIGETFTDNGDEFYLPGDTVFIYGSVLNVLPGTSSASTRYRVSCESPYIEFIDSIQNLLSLAKDNSVSTISVPISFVVKEGIPLNEEISFKVFMEDGDYYNWDMMKTTFNPDYLNITENNIKFSVGASGKLGFSGPTKDQSIGLGVKYKTGNNMLFQMGIIASLDEVKTSFMFDSSGEEWEANSGIKLSYGQEADAVVYSEYDDDPAGLNKLGLTVSQKTMAWTDSDRMDFIILEMNIKNNSGAEINGLNFGIFSDWDINNYALNHAVYNESIKTGYCYFPGGEYGGFHVLSDSAIQHYAFDKNSPLNHVDGLTSFEQYSSISGGNLKDSSGLEDVAQIIGVGGLNILEGDSIKLAFALVVGDSYQVIKNASLEADTAYQELYNLNTKIVQNDSASCYSYCDGRAKVWARGGVGKLSYSWIDFSTSSNSDSITGVCADTIHCEISDESGLIDTLEILIHEPNKVLVSLGNDTAICQGESVTLDGGEGASYFWLPGGETTQVISVNMTNDYSVLVTDINSCSFSDSLFVTVNSLPNITFTDTTMSDGVTCDGEINGLIFGGLPPYSFSWSDDSLRDSIHCTNLCSGLYLLTVSDDNSCFAIDSIEIEDTSPVNIGEIDVPYSIYPNPTSGIITINGTKSTAKITVTDLLGQIKFATSTKNKTVDLSELPGGTYFIYISQRDSKFIEKVVIKK